MLFLPRPWHWLSSHERLAVDLAREGVDTGCCPRPATPFGPRGALCWLLGRTLGGLRRCSGSGSGRGARSVPVPHQPPFLLHSEGSNLTPAHHFQDFRFKTYAPVAFRYFRELFGIRPDDYLVRAVVSPLLPCHEF